MSADADLLHLRAEHPCPSPPDPLEAVSTVVAEVPVEAASTVVAGASEQLLVGSESSEQLEVAELQGYQRARDESAW